MYATLEQKDDPDEVGQLLPQATTTRMQLTQRRRDCWGHLADAHSADDAEQTVELLNEVTAALNKARAKLDKGRTYCLVNEIWEARGQRNFAPML